MSEHAPDSVPSAGSESKSDPGSDPASESAPEDGPDVAVIVGARLLHVADSANPDRQRWDYDEETLGALIRHLEAISVGTIRVAGEPPSARLLPLLRHLVHLEVPLAVLEGGGSPKGGLRPRDLLGAANGPRPLEDGLRARLVVLDRRLSELREMRAREVARRADRADSPLAESLERHVRWLVEREETLRDRFIDLLRASPVWGTIRGESDPG